MTRILEPQQLEDMFTRLKSAAALQMNQATAMPPEVYHAPEVLEIEREKLFGREWLCVGRTVDMPDKGDYLTWHIQEQQVLVVRQADGGIRAYSNTCRHRMMRLLEGRGTCNRIVCPYHAWTYDLSGQLIGAPFMERSDGFDKKQIKLPEIRCEIWHGWIYVTLNEEAQPVKEKLARLEPLIECYDMEGYVSIVLDDREWSANWKLLAENFMEGYHLPVAHASSVGAYCPVENTEFAQDGPDENFTFQLYTKDETAPVGNAHPANTTLSGKWRRTSILPTVFPSHMFSLAPDHLWYLSIQPNGVDRVTIRYGAAIAPEVLENHPNREAFINDTISFLSQVQGEDRFLVEGLHKGTASALSAPGHLSWLEHENHDFMQYIARHILPKKGMKIAS